MSSRISTLARLDMTSVYQPGLREVRRDGTLVILSLVMKVGLCTEASELSMREKNPGLETAVTDVEGPYTVADDSEPLDLRELRERVENQDRKAGEMRVRRGR